MKNCFSILVPGLIGLVLVAGCSAPSVSKLPITPERTVLPQVAGPDNMDKPLLKSSDRIGKRAFDLYVLALISENLGDYFSAAEYYKKALQYYPNSYEIRFSFAKMLFQTKAYSETVEALSVIKPVDSDVYDLRATAFRGMGAHDSARATYLQAVAVDSSNSMAYSFLASYYRQLRMIDSTIWAFQNLIRLRPDNYRLENDLAKLHLRARDPDGAISAFARSIEINPDVTNIMAYIGGAEVFSARNQNDSALAWLHRGWEVEPDDIVINRYIAGAYVQVDSLTKAIPYARRLAELLPLDRPVSRRLGALYFAIDSLGVADSVFSALVRSGERNPINHTYLGQIAMHDQYYERARDEFSMVTSLVDSLAEGWLGLGFAYQRLGQRDKEILTYQTALNRVRDEQGGLRIYFALGAAYEQAGQIDKSIETFEEIIANSPDHSQSLNYLGYLLADRGERLDYAQALLQRAIALSPDNPAFLDSYGWVFYRKGNFQQAVVYLNKAVSLDSDPIMFDHLGDAYNATGNRTEATKWWKKALELTPDNEEIQNKLIAD